MRDGRFTEHDAGGDTLHLSDIYTDPDAREALGSAACYDALKHLCRALGLRRIAAGGRLWGYFEFAARLAAKQYVDQAIAGTLRDRVPSSQLRAGFHVRGVVADYLRDPRSGNSATLLEWVNPDVPA